MNDAFRKQKDLAAGLVAKGKLPGALEAYVSLVRIAPEDLQLRQKLGDVLAKLGRPQEAIAAYQAAAKAYGHRGELLKAISLFKVIQQLDPTHKEMQTSLAQLYAKQRGTEREVFSPSLATVAATPAAPVAAQTSRSGTQELELDEGDGESLVLSVMEDAADRAAHPPKKTKTSPKLSAAPSAKGKLSRNAPMEFELDLESDLSPIEGEVIIEGVEQEVVQEMEAVLLTTPKVARKAPRLDKLPAIPLFSELSPSAFVALMEGMEVKTFSAGDVVVKEGSHGQSMFAIVQGRVSVRRKVGKEERSVAEMSDGAFFGEMTLVTDAPRFATVVAENDLVVLEFTRRQMELICQDHPSVAKVMERFYRARLLANVLRSNAIFRPLDEAQKEQVQEHFIARKLDAGEAVLEQGQKGDGFYVVLRGSCEVIDETPGKKAHRFPELSEGDVFGEISVLLDLPVSATVKAKEQSVVLRLNRNAFRSLVSAHPQVRELVVALGRERWQRSQQLVREPGAGDERV